MELYIYIYGCDIYLSIYNKLVIMDYFILYYIIRGKKDVSKFINIIYFFNNLRRIQFNFTTTNEQTSKKYIYISRCLFMFFGLFILF